MSSMSIPETPTAGTVLVVNKGDRTLALVDAQTMKVVDVIELSGPGHEVAAHPELPIAYVPIYSNAPVGAPGTDCSTIDVIDLVGGRRRTTSELNVPCRPHCAMFGSDGLLYVTTEVTKTVTVLNPATLSVVRTLNTGHAQSHMLALSPDGTRGYTANVRPGSISEIDLESGTLLRTIEIASEINRITLSADGSFAFTADQHQRQTRPRRRPPGHRGAVQPTTPRIAPHHRRSGISARCSASTTGTPKPASRRRRASGITDRSSASTSRPRRNNTWSTSARIAEGE